MIELNGVTKRYRMRNGMRTVLDGITARFPRGRNVGVLGRNGAGKSTLIRLLARGEYPDEGTIRSSVRISWPLGFSGGMQNAMTGIDHVRFIARIYGVDWREILRFVQEFSELGSDLEQPIGTYSSGMRSRLVFGVSMAIDFECYLIDELTAVGDAQFSARCRRVFAERRGHASVILVSHSSATIRQMCDMGAILHRGKLTMYEDLDEAIEVYRKL